MVLYSELRFIHNFKLFIPRSYLHRSAVCNIVITKILYDIPTEGITSEKLNY